MVNDREFVRALVACGALKFGTFTLASGKTSDYYVDIKKATTRPDLLGEIARRIAPHAKGFQRVAGVELGAVPIAAAVSLEIGTPFVIVRKEAKEHGTKVPFEGDMNPGDRVVFVEDVVTTGGTLRTAIERMRERGAVIQRAIAVVDREEGGTEALREAGVELVALLRARDLRAA